MFLRSATLIITSSVMGSLAIAAVTLRLWAKGMRKTTKMGADDALIVLGLVMVSSSRFKLQFVLTLERLWHLACAFATLSEQRCIDSGTTKYTSSVVL